MPPRRNRGSQARRFMLTYNNPSHDVQEFTNFFRERCWNYVFQLERGEDGAEHYQIFIRIPRKMYLTSFIERWVTFGCHPHIKIARSWIDAMRNCSNVESRVGDDFYADIREDMNGLKVSALVKVKRMIDTGFRVKNVADKEKYFATWLWLDKLYILLEAVLFRLNLLLPRVFK